MNINKKYKLGKKDFYYTTFGQKTGIIPLWLHFIFWILIAIGSICFSILPILLEDYGVSVFFIVMSVMFIIIPISIILRIEKITKLYLEKGSYGMVFSADDERVILEDEKQEQKRTIRFENKVRMYRSLGYVFIEEAKLIKIAVPERIFTDEEINQLLAKKQ